MIDRLLGIKFHDRFQVFALLVIAVGLPWTKILMSIGVMLLLLNLLLEAKFSVYWNNLKSKKVVIFLVALLFLQVLSMLWSKNLDYALWDFRVKMPMYAIPLVLFSRPISNDKELQFVLFGFLGTLFVTSLINYGSYHQWFGDRTIIGIRDLSLFESHIRYGLCIVMGIGILLFWMKQKKFHIIPSVLLVMWFCYYTWFSQVVSAVVALLAVLFLLLFLWLFVKNKTLGLSLLILPVFSGIMVFNLVQPAERVELDTRNLPTHTAQGNLYLHYMHEFSIENGLPVFAFFCEEELKQSWNERSEIAFDGKDRRGQLLYATLCRYLTSMDLTKDALGMKSLSQEDIVNIENGHASRDEAKGGMYARVLAIRYELTYSGDPNEHSLLQRLAFWNAGLNILKQNWLIGVGAGDVQGSFDTEYERSNSSLAKENRLRAHNQFLTYFISLGILGFVIFLSLLISRLRLSISEGDVLTVVFLCIFTISCLAEDTLETQAGVTFFGLFFALFRRIKKDAHQIDEHFLQS